MKADPSRIYVGNLTASVTKELLFDIFSQHGKLRGVEMKQAGGQRFAFVEFEDEQDALVAIRQKNSTRVKDCVLRVEMPRAAAAAVARSRKDVDTRPSVSDPWMGFPGIAPNYDL